MHTIQIFMSSVYCEYLDTVILTDLVKVTLAGVKGVSTVSFRPAGTHHRGERISDAERR